MNSDILLGMLIGDILVLAVLFLAPKVIKFRQERVRKNLYAKAKRLDACRAIGYLRLASCATCLTTLSDERKVPKETIQEYFVDCAQRYAAWCALGSIFKEPTDPKQALENLNRQRQRGNYRTADCKDDLQHNKITGVPNIANRLLWELIAENNDEIEKEQK